MPSTDDQLKRLVEQLQEMPGMAETLPRDQGDIVRDALVRPEEVIASALELLDEA